MSEIQEWVETRGGSAAKEVENKITMHTWNVKEASQWVAEKHFPPDKHEREYIDTIAAALAWKACASISAHFIGLAEGWCEAYYRDLWKLYSEEKP
jgi:hypothetical protein